MFTSIPLDIAGPGLLNAAGISMLVFCPAISVIIVIEGFVLWALKWGELKPTAMCTVVMNLVTTVIGIGVVPFTIELGLWGLLIDFVLSVLVEFFILTMFKRGATHENWNAALFVNTASYLLIIIPLYLFFGLLG